MENKNTDNIIDKLLAAQPAKASDDFMDKLQISIAAEKQLDASFKLQKLHATNAFTDSVMRKIRLMKITNFMKPAISVFAAAASITLAFTIFTGSQTHFDENGIFNELYQIDSQMASFDYFEELSINYEANNTVAIAAFFDGDF